MSIVSKNKFDFSGFKQMIENHSYKKERSRLELLEKIKKILEFQKENLPVSSIYIFGSITRANMFDTLSDVDIAIGGFDNSISIFKFWNEMEDLLGHKTDLLELENCSFRSDILSKGIKIK